MKDKNLMLEQKAQIKEKAAALKAEKKIRKVYPMVMLGDTNCGEKEFYLAYKDEPVFPQFSKFMAASKKDEMNAMRQFDRDRVLNGRAELGTQTDGGGKNLSHDSAMNDITTISGDDNMLRTTLFKLAATNRKVLDFILRYPGAIEDSRPLMGLPRSGSVHTLSITRQNSRTTLLPELSADCHVGH